MSSSNGLSEARSRAVPRGPAEWGRLLYEPLWAMEKRYRGGRELYMEALIMVMGVLLVGVGLFMAIVEAGIGLLLAGMGVFVFFLGYGTVRAQVKGMPFRMYERGFTRTEVPFGQGMRRAETLVYYEMLERVSVESTSFSGITLNHLKVSFTGPDGSTVDQTLSFEDPDNPLDVMVLFQRFAPDRLDRGMELYVGPGAIDAAIPVPFEERQGSASHDVRGVVMSTGMMLFIALLTGFMMAGLGMNIAGFIIAVAFQLIMYAVFIGMGGMLTVRGFKSSVGDRVKVAGDRLTLPRSTLARLYADTRHSLPLVEVRQVRKALDTTFFGHKAVMVTAAGERVVTRHTLWESLRGHPSFTQEGFVLNNRRPFTGTPRPLIVVNRWKMLAVAMSMLLLSILIGLSAGGGGDAFFDAWDRYSPYLIGFMLGVMVPLYIVIRVLIAKRASLGKNIMSSDMGLMMPGKDGSPHWISKAEVRSVEVKKDLLGYYIELVTVEGVEKLPLSAAPKMDSADIHVVDGPGILTRVPAQPPVDMVPPPVPGAEAPRPERVERSRVSGRGALLSEMPAEKVESERRKANTMGLATTAGAVAAGAFMLVAAPTFFGDVLCTIFVGIMVVLLGVLGVLLMVTARRIAPVRVYENGVEWASIAKGLHFLGWGDFETAREATFGGNRMLTLTRDSRAAGSISADMSGYDEWLPMIMERVNDPAFASEIETLPEGATRYWALPMVLMVIAMGLGIGTAIYAGDDIGDDMTVSGWDLYLLMGMSTALVYFFVIMFWMMVRNSFGLTKARFPTVALVVPVAVMLLVYFVVMGATGPVSLRYTVDIVESDDPGTSVLEAGEYVDTDIRATGPVTVGAGETLTLHNVTLTFDPAPGPDYGIWVHPEGTLLLDDARITSADTDVGFSFEIHGKAVFMNSLIVGTAVDPDFENGEGGVELYCGDIRVENTVFRNALSAAMMTVYCSPTITNCTFSGAHDEAIEVHGGTPFIENCTFKDCQWPLILWNGSEAVIANCTFEDCPRGIDLVQSSATIRGCTFRNIEGYAIQWTSDTEPEPVMEDNVFDNVGAETDVQTSLALLGTLCTIVTLVTALIGTAALLMMNRKRPERTRPREEAVDLTMEGM